MRLIKIQTFMSLDGVMQAPGGPDEDTPAGLPWAVGRSPSRRIGPQCPLDPGSQWPLAGRTAMTPLRVFATLIAAGGAFLASPAMASDEAFEFWLNPSVETDLDEDTSVELETAQRFRSESDGRVDTYFARGWVKQELTDDVTLAGALEYRVNDGGSNEVRTMQQLSTSHGVVKTRLRLEQRFVDGADRMGLRLRPRVGVGFDLTEDGRWSAGADVELFWVLRGNNVGSDTGITGLRTTIGVDYEVSENLSIGASYLRQQDFEDDGPDEIGHAPLIGLEYTF